jgi:glycine oxidase
MARGEIGIAGAGLLGRLLAWHLSQQGFRVQVFDPAPGAAPLWDGQGAAGFTAAGMLSPLAELDNAEADVAARGWLGLTAWTAVAQALGAPEMVQRQGSLLVAHGSDLGAAQRVLARLQKAALDPVFQAAARAQPGHGSGEGAGPASIPAAQAGADDMVNARPLAGTALQALEPDLHGSQGPLHAWWLPGEGHIDTPAMLMALHEGAREVTWHWSSAVDELDAGRIRTRDGQQHAFDSVIDTRGVGARPALDVRGVRGEVVWLHAPEVKLQRPVRLLHPRHRVYIVPRGDGRVLIGASEIESEDRSPVSLRSAVELMAAAHSVIPALAEARILKLDVNLRPATPDHRPVCQAQPGLLRLNGLYRHGWLLGPALAQEGLAAMGWPSLPGLAPARPAA